MSLCKACYRPDRDSIDRQIIAGTPYRTIAAGSGLSIAALSRHKRHIQEMMKERSAGEAAKHRSNLSARLDKRERVAEELLAVTNDDIATACKILNTLIRIDELRGKADGELMSDGAGVHFHSNTQNNNLVIVGDDRELALLIHEATAGFNPERIAQLKQLAESTEKPT